MIYLPTTDTSTEKRLSPASLKSFIEATANDPGAGILVSHHIKYGYEEVHQPTARIQPDPRIQPGTGGGYWSEDAWAQRFVFDIGDKHLLFTAKEDGSPPNRHLNLMCHGDAFLLFLSNTKDSDGQMVYRSILPNGTPEKESELIEICIGALREAQDQLVKLSQRAERR